MTPAGPIPAPASGGRASRRSAAVAAVTAALLVAGASWAQAFWTPPTATVHTDAAAAWSAVVEQVDGPLLPGRPVRAVAVFRNADPGARVVDAVSSVQVAVTHPAPVHGCPRVPLQVALSGDAPVLAGRASTSMPLTLTLAADAPTGCQGRDLTITVSLATRPSP